MLEDIFLRHIMSVFESVVQQILLLCFTQQKNLLTQQKKLLYTTESFCCTTQYNDFVETNTTDCNITILTQQIQTLIIANTSLPFLN
jgi:hypothetical protein